MAHTDMKFPEKMRRFSHGLDPLNPFLIYHGVKSQEMTDFFGDIHLDPQLFIIVSGTVDFHLNDYMHKGKSGDILISNFWEPHAFKKTSSTLDFVVITFSLFSLGNGFPFADFDWLAFMSRPPAQRKIKFEEEEKKEILALTQKIIRLHQEQPPGYRSMLWLAVHELLYHINLKYVSQTASARRSRPETKLFPALELLRKFPQREIPLDEAAAACCMSRSAFCSAFKRVMNESFSHFAMKKRISYAGMLLKSGKHSIKEVSDLCGFVNVTHFYHTFKKFQNKTPAEFKQP